MPTPSSIRPWREAIAALHGLGWGSGDIASALRVSEGTVLRECGIRPWELPDAPTTHCSQRIGGFWCDRPVRPGQVYCDDHWRLGWPAQDRPA